MVPPRVVFGMDPRPAPDASCVAHVSGSGESEAGFGIGDVLDGTAYRLTRLLGRGASAFVFRAEHTKLRSRVVVKLLAARVDEAPERADRMRLEAQALARLRHPNLVEVIDSGFARGRLFFVMDDDGGLPLTEAIGANGRMAPTDAVAVLSDVLDGLAFVHGEGLVHRDLHPDNLLVCPLADGRRVVRILDLGLVKLVGGHERHRLAPLAFPTALGAAVGTPRYMAPEQVRGLPVDARADLYAAGCVLYRLLVGRDPFAHHATPAEVLEAHLHESPIAPSRRVGGGEVGPALDAVVARALAKLPEARHPDATAMKAALLAAVRADAARALPGLPTVGDGARVWDRMEPRDARDADAGGPAHGPALAPPVATVPLAVATVPLTVETVPLAVATVRLAVEPSALTAAPTANGARSPRPAPQRRRRSGGALGVFLGSWLGCMLLTVALLVAMHGCRGEGKESRGEVGVDDRTRTR